MKEKKKFIRKIKNKYRLSVYNENTFEEVLRFRLSRLNVVAFVVGVAFLVSSLVVVLLVFTPLKGLIPGYPDGSMRKGITQNAILVDSLSLELEKRDRFFNSIRSIIQGEVSTEEVADTATEPIRSSKKVVFKKSADDSLFRERIENEEKYNLLVFDEARKKEIGFTNLHFYSPVEGIVTNHFDFKENHFGVDIVAGPKARIGSILDGTVVFAEWSVKTGYVIQIQHAHNLISIYKHNAILLKKPGDRVKAGEAIAILGNSGELSTGPHLHLEIWHEGKALNPEELISF